MKIEVNNYVITSKGYIFYNLSKKQINGLRLLNKQYGNITKHSKNLIDLIEAGDIVEVLCGELNKETNTIEIKNNEQIETLKFAPKFIKSILTKEQYNQNCYRLEE